MKMTEICLAEFYIFFAILALSYTTIKAEKLSIPKDLDHKCTIEWYQNQIRNISWDEPDTSLALCDKLKAFDQSIETQAFVDYYKGRSYRAQGNYNQAIENFQIEL